MAETEAPVGATSSSRPRVLLPPPPCAPDLLCANAAEKKLYWDRSHYDSPESQIRALGRSSTLYIGNLAFSTRTSHLRSLFSRLGPVASVHLGLDRFRKTPCGFAFVEYERRPDALRAVTYLTGTKLDGRPIRVELDAGFKPGRQYGRGMSGGQVRDDRRATVDPARRKSGERAGGMGSRWQAPGSGEPRAYPSAGEKRSRDDDEDTHQRPSKNPRFGGEGSDEDM
eukprot:CAMPEP_0113544530 /NCGR_PEP_ID=MMETSP0015_2-20120614/10760_1 /TAXON_ID=2838 /ORGANISM="Odontella" /LENGTH=225 /DNA_ID=CAMNT_0000444801 /DNA_START=56 /DNA_END=733 /DNA_ORIENTATION=+ /assembly_acc=CAM_ASM_000160